jgi:hypothetical protein
LGIPLSESEPGKHMDQIPQAVAEAPSVGIAEGIVIEKFDA